MNVGEKHYCSKCMRETEEYGVCPHCGYKNDKVVRNIKDLKVDDIITIKFKEGIVKANIKEIGE